MISNIFWLALCGAALLGCTDPNVDDTNVEGDTDTDTDVDTDTDADVYATSVAHVLDGLPTSFSVYDNFDPLICDDVVTCRIDVYEASEIDVYAKRDGFIFPPKRDVDLTTAGDHDTLWGAGQYGANLEGTFKEVDEVGNPTGWTFEVEMISDGDTLAVRLGLPIPDAPMTGLEFAHDDGDTWSTGYATDDRNEIFVNYGSYQSGNTYSKHFVRGN